MTVRYRDGKRQHIFLDNARGMQKNPFTPDQRAAKLYALTDDVIDCEQGARLFDTIGRLPPNLPIDEITSLLQ